MLYTARGKEAWPKFKLAQLLASTAAWQSICGGVSADDAFDRIHWPDADDTEIETEDGSYELRRNNPMPRAIVDFADDWMFERSEGGTRTFKASLVLTFELPAPRVVGLWPSAFWPAGFWPDGFWPDVELSQRDRQVAFENRIGDCLDQMMAKAATTPVAGDVQDAGYSHLNVLSIQQMMGPTLSDPRECLGEEYGGAIYRIGWQ